ncbi:hypothetical protein ACFWAR_10085 [Streptomyces sp. NPDC059917]|uniref:hypothetical protein n=1 Tax=Streptomyces sp. NPDC059917 TaxID=3347002 RepID=UPI00364BB71C
MTKINFNEPSRGETASGDTTFSVSNRGSGQALAGESFQGEGIRGVSHSEHGAVVGINDKTNGRGDAAWFESSAGEGCHGVSHSLGSAGVVGINDNPDPGSGAGVYGESKTFEGVRGVSHSYDHGAVVGVNLSRGMAGYFDGNVHVTGRITHPGADYAEALTVAAPAAVGPGMVMVLDDGGRITPCSRAYDDRVAGIVSGAGGVQPAMVLDDHEGAAPIALMGKLWVRADASQAPIRCGDLLTTSATTGHACRVTDRERAFGAVVGKALTDLPSGRGMVRVLVSAS